MIYEGSNPVASQNRLLGQFQLVKLPPAPARVPRVQVNNLQRHCWLINGINAHGTNM